jgi:glycosyltransferase involved in cell wall biosynthesis
MRALNLLFQRRTTHLQVVDERDATDARIRDIGLDRDDVIFVTRSDSVRERLSTKLMRQDRIRVVEGFLSPARIASLHPRAPFDESGVRRVLVSCPDGDAEAIRLFLGALKDDSAPPFLNYLIRAESDQRDEIREMLRDEPGVSLIPGGIATAGVVASCDLLLRLGDSDFVDFITLEALATGVPVLTAAFESRTSPISDGANGFCYRSGDSADLAAQLRRLASISFDQLNAVAKGGRYLVDIRYSADSGVERFKRLFGHSRAPVPEFNGGKLIL